MNRTPWFVPPAKPAREGVYERAYPSGVVYFCLYFAGKWRRPSQTAVTAARELAVSEWQNCLHWRGRTKKSR